MSFASGLKTIVVATDLDPRADAALEYARKLAVSYGARIVFAHGLDSLDYALVAAVPGKVLRSLTEQPRATLDQMSADLVREGIHSHSEIRQGQVAQMLVDVARQCRAGLILIGTEGRQGASPIVVGAVAEQLAAMLGGERHTCTLIAQSRGTAMRLPKEAMHRAFQLYPPLRIQLLEEQAREVSRASGIGSATRRAGIRRRPAGTA